MPPAWWHWLVEHNLWQSVISWVVFTGLNGFWALRLWRKHKASQADIQDKLDTKTPGGLGEVAAELRRLLSTLDGDDGPDDGGDPEKRTLPRGHGGNSASHR